MLAFTVCSGKIEKTPNKPSLEMSFNGHISFWLNLTLSKVQLEEHLPVFPGLGEAGSGLSKSQESCRLSQEAAALPGARLLWSLLGAGAQPRLLEPGTGGELPILARAMLPGLLPGVGMWD